MRNDRNDFRNDINLIRQADELLASAGNTIWGDPKSRENYEQKEFERRMSTGAYGNGGDRKRKK